MRGSGAGMLLCCSFCGAFPRLTFSLRPVRTPLSKRPCVFPKRHHQAIQTTLFGQQRARQRHHLYVFCPRGPGRSEPKLTIPSLHRSPRHSFAAVFSLTFADAQGAGKALSCPPYIPCRLGTIVP
ncbi:unnamed protein product [Ectocarpus sp. 8 AP-2014]